MSYHNLLVSLRSCAFYFADNFEVNITDLIQEKFGTSIYTTILAQYVGFPERLLQWYVNGRPVGQTNTVFSVKYDGLNSYLRFKHNVNETYGTFMLKVDGTKWKDILKLPNLQQLSSVFGSSKAFVNKLVTKVVNGNLLSNVKTITDSQSDTSANQFLSHDKHRPTNKKFRPEVIRLGQDRKLKAHTKSLYIHQDSMFSSQTNLPPSTNIDRDSKFLKEVIRLGENWKQKGTNTNLKHQPTHDLSHDKNTREQGVLDDHIQSTPPQDLSEFKLQ